jgi:hypothetical protein
MTFKRGVGIVIVVALTLLFWYGFIRSLVSLF